MVYPSYHKQVRSRCGIISMVGILKNMGVKRLDKIRKG